MVAQWRGHQKHTFSHQRRMRAAAKATNEGSERDGRGFRPQVALHVLAWYVFQIQPIMLRNKTSLYPELPRGPTRLTVTGRVS